MYTHLLHAACWSRACVLRVADARQALPTLVQGLGAMTAATTDHVVQHAISICRLPVPFLQLWQQDRSEMWVEGRDRRGRAGSFKQQLEMVWALPYPAKPELNWG